MNKNKNSNFRLVREPTRTSSPTFLNSDKQIMQGIRETAPPTTAEWTDEKHSMYIKSIEASFVNQLYDSKQMRTSYDLATTSGQFKVLRAGCWQKINFERVNPQMSRNNQCHDLTANPWIQHYRSSNKQRSIVAPSLQESVTTTSKAVDLGQKKGIPSGSGHLHLCESHVCHKDMLCSSDTEMSDQNFVDEEVKGKRENKRSKAKRQKSLISNAKGNDQMVPNSKSSGDVTKNRVSAA